MVRRLFHLERVQRVCRWRSEIAEADGVLGFGADDRVTECLGGHDDATALVIGQIDRRVVGHGLRDGLAHIVG